MEGLMRSCNPWFYQIGLTLYDEGFTDLVAETARDFGLASATGIQSLPEAEGQVLSPDENPDIGRGEAVQQGIGHGSTTITPLQAAVYTAALGNGGTLYRPFIVERVETPDGEAALDFEPEAVGTLPISDNTLSAIQTGMRMVITDPRGTAYNRFLGFTVPVFGKTGTPSIAGQDPHAWFIGYTDFNSPSNPDIAIAVLVENIGDGSEFAAPIFRRVASYHFFNTPGPLYPWENDFGVLDPTYFEDAPADDASDTSDDSNDNVIRATALP
jgi:penicillin-binding protein 2